MCENIGNTFTFIIIVVYNICVYFSHFIRKIK